MSKRAKLRARAAGEVKKKLSQETTDFLSEQIAQRQRTFAFLEAAREKLLRRRGKLDAELAALEDRQRAASAAGVNAIAFALAPLGLRREDVNSVQLLLAKKIARWTDSRRAAPGADEAEDATREAIAAAEEARSSAPAVAEPSKPSEPPAPAA